ncbi:hypothetical protein Bcav_3765 [Beutenbergia cavernae DSM 12333]|uniref:Uncharacterized protein n=1 Tax=Beutenbergia cavernae (strain ATCC BAA-8 / DSM 12333 / CCUG 43141 / JCM 11478 / NBRC 16432 / NCIMB 13614 / HKI 0122) TaxID=471853 RepID=C5C3U8_BEUC1|nr:hypothetical protein [Beutenbergia cavernae]ACQ82007.1 hypothetical protein Bcav_3765 [Beutenbergia cavernae DSM 12333]
MRADENVWPDERCVDCGDPLRFGDEVTCRWCDAHRAERPEVAKKSA